MGIKSNLEGFWNEWGLGLITWLLTHGLRIVIIILAAYLINYLSRKFIEKVVKVSVTADRHRSQIAERKREETLTTFSINFLER